MQNIASKEVQGAIFWVNFFKKRKIIRAKKIKNKNVILIIIKIIIIINPILSRMKL